MRKKNNSYSPPKFSKGQVVKTPSGEEKEIELIAYHLGSNWYLIDGRQYNEIELHEV